MSETGEKNKKQNTSDMLSLALISEPSSADIVIWYEADVGLEDKSWSACYVKVQWLAFGSFLKHHQLKQNPVIPY